VDDNDIGTAMIEMGWRTRAARQRLGMTQDELAAKLGVSRPTIVGYETSNAGKFSVETAMRLASVLGVRVGWLLSGQGARDAKAVKP
jgi:transcriptional regulator with XRE-family HTH domain